MFYIYIISFSLFCLSFFLYQHTMSDFSIFLGGENRVVLPFFAYPALVIAPTLALALGVIVPTDRLPSIVKQILSIPLLLAVFMIPFGFTNGNKGNLYSVVCLLYVLNTQATAPVL